MKKTILVISACLMLIGFSSGASVFDDKIDPCHGTFSESDLRSKGNKLLEGEVNFITVQDPIPNTHIFYRLVCDRRLYSLLVIKEQKESKQQIERALDAIAWQSTFSDEAAQTLIDFINTSRSRQLKEKAAFAFYYLHDIFPKVNVILDFYETQEFKTFYEKMLASDFFEISSKFVQVAQKVAGYFTQTERHCYRPQYSEETRAQGERAARIFVPRLVDALFARMINQESDAVGIRTEILVALENFAFSEYARTDKTFHERLNEYKRRTKDVVDAQVIDSLLTTMKQPCD